nr:MAG TPA: Protein of unknown function (DUF3853) [Caudoviricetes sp.]
MSTATSSLVVLTPEELQVIIDTAIASAVHRLRHELSRSDEQTQVVGRQAIMDYLGISTRKSLKERIDRYPSAFFSDGKRTLILFTDKLRELQMESNKMLRSTSRRLK